MPGSVELFSKHKLPSGIFIETGAESGTGIQQALDAGYEQIYSIELVERSFLYCYNKFKNEPKVKMIFGDGALQILWLLERIKSPATFWLDGHGVDDYPVLKELESISKHHIKTHTILIDDLRLFNLERHGLDLESITGRIQEINPNYSFSFADGQDGYGTPVKDDILISQIL